MSRLTRRFFGTLAAVLMVAAMGCEQTYLGDPQSAKLDSNLVGWWEGKDDDGHRLLACITPLDEHTYDVSYFTYTATGPEAECQARGWLSQAAGATVLTVRLTGAEWELAAPAKPLYAHFKIELKGDTLRTWQLNNSKFDDAATPDALAKSVEQHAKDADLWNEFNTFQRVDASKRHAELSGILRSFHRTADQDPDTAPSPATAP